MPIVLAKCTECGGTIKVDSEKKLGICENCGQPFVVEEAINNFTNYYETNYITNHNYGEGAVVNVYEDRNKDFVIEAGVLKEYHGASVNVVVPEGVKSIAKDCFKNMNIESIELPSSLNLLNRSLDDIYPRLKTINVSEGNDVYSVDDNVLIHHFENNRKTIEYIAGNRDSYSIPADINEMTIGSGYLKHLYWNNYDLRNLSCNEISVIESVKGKFPLSINHRYVDYQCQDCGEYNFNSWDYIYFKAGAKIWFAGDYIAQLAVYKGNYMELFPIDEIKDSLLSKITNVKKLILLDLNGSKDDFHFAYSSNKAPDYEQIRGYNFLLGMFSNVTELVIEQDTTYYDSKQEKYFSVLKDIFENTEIFYKCSQLTFGKEFSEDLKNELENMRIQKIENEKQQSVIDMRKSQNKCIYCGGEFKYPLFGSIKCKNCGKSKDY